MYPKRQHPVVVACAVAVVLAGCSGSHPATTGAAVHGGVLTITLARSQWPDLDPGTDVLATADAPMLDAIYGQLLALGPNGAVVPDLAAGYAMSNGARTLTITLRPGLTFQDGSRFSATDVVQSITRDLGSSTCSCAAVFAKVTTVEATSPLTVRIRLSSPFAALPAAFVDEAPNWVVSMTALATLGEHRFSLLPIGAGPFQVTENTPSATLGLVAFAHYWQPSHPYLSGLKFVSVGEDDAAYDEVVSQPDTLALGITSVHVVQQAGTNRSVQLVVPPASAFEFVALNETRPPFDQREAREALAAATNPAGLVATLYGGQFGLTEEPDAPGDAFFTPVVPGYRGYDPMAARRLVHALGGVSFTLVTTTDTPLFDDEANALAKQWRDVGITARVKDTSLSAMVRAAENGDWQAIDATWGGNVDPAVTLPVFFASSGLFSGTRDPTLDALLDKGATLTAVRQRRDAYVAAWSQIARNVDAVPLYADPTYILAGRAVRGLDPDMSVPDWAQLFLKS